MRSVAPLALGSVGFPSRSDLDRSQVTAERGCLRSTVSNRNPSQQSAPFVEPASDGSLATAGQGEMQLQPAKRCSEGLVQFDYYVIGGKVVDGQEGVGHIRVVG